MPPARALHEWRKLKNGGWPDLNRRVRSPTKAPAYIALRGGLADYNAACRGGCMGKKEKKKMAGCRIRTDERLPLPEHPHIY